MTSPDPNAVEPSVIPILDAKTGAMAQMSPADATKAFLDGTHGFMPDQQVPMVGPDGVPKPVVGTQVRQALDAGFTFETRSQADVRRYVEDNKGAVGALKVGAGGLANEALFGVPEVVAEHVAGEQATKKWEALKEDHPVANVVGKAAGIAASTVVGGELFKGAQLAGKAAESMVAGEKALVAAGLEGTASSFGRQAAGRVANYGVQGAIVSAPRAAAQAFTGDPELAGETLLWGGGTGALLGGVSVAARAASRSVSKGLSTLAEIAAEHPEAAGNAAAKAVQSTVAAVGHHVVPGFGGLMGLELSKEASLRAKDAVTDWVRDGGVKVASRYLRDLAESPMSSGFGTAMAQQGESVLAQHLAKVPAIVASLASEEETSAAGPTQKERQDFDKVSRQITALATDPNSLADLTANFAAPLSHDSTSEQVALQTQLKMQGAVQWLYAQLPKRTELPLPFTKDNWQPSAQELASFQRKLEIFQDPLAVFHHLTQGSISRDHVEALKAIYPATYAALQRTVLEASTLPNAPALPYDSRVKLSLLLGTDLDQSLQQHRLAALQGAFSAPPQADKAQPAPPKKVVIKGYPSPATESQRISAGLPGRAKAA